jgi:hypothetical protein
MRAPHQAAPRPLSRPWDDGGILWDMDMLWPGESNTGLLRKWSSSADRIGKAVLEVSDDWLNVQLTSHREPLLIEPGEDALC